MATNILAPPTYLKQGVPATGTAMQVVDTVAAALLALPVDSSTAAPSLQADMQAAQALATQWNNDYGQQVEMCLQGIINYNSEFQYYFQSLYAESEQIAAGDSSAIPPFQATLTNLQQLTQSESDATQFVQQSLLYYSDQIATSQQALNSDEVEINDAISSDQAELQIDQQEMNYIEGEEQELYWNIAKYKGDYWIQEFQILMDEINQSLNTLTNQMNAVSADANANATDLTNLQSSLADVTSYLTDLSQLLSGVGSLTTGWEEITGDFQNLLEDEDITTYSVFTPDDVAAAAKDWSELALLAHSFLKGQI